MANVRHLLEKKFSQLYKKESALKVVEKGNATIINGFISVYYDGDEYSLEYEKANDIYMETFENVGTMIDKIICLVLERIAAETKAVARKQKKALASCL